MASTQFKSQNYLLFYFRFNVYTFNYGAEVNKNVWQIFHAFMDNIYSINTTANSINILFNLICKVLVCISAFSVMPKIFVQNAFDCEKIDFFLFAI